MAQIRVGKVAVTNGSPTVTALWRMLLRSVAWSGTVTGSGLSPGETLAFQSSGAVGTYLSTAGGVLYFSLVAGRPYSTEVARGVTSGASVTLTGTAQMSPTVGSQILRSGFLSLEGTLVAWDPKTREILFSAAPTVAALAGETVQLDYGSAGLHPGTIVSSARTVAWQTGPADEQVLLGAEHSIFAIRGAAATYDVIARTNGTLTLSTNYAGATATNLEYTISQDFDADTGMALLNANDVDVPSLWNRNIRRLKLLLGNAIGLFTSPPSFSGNARKTSRVNAAGTALELIEPAVLDDPSGNTVAQVMKKNTKFDCGASRWPLVGAIDAEVGAPAGFGGRLQFEPSTGAANLNKVNLEVFSSGGQTFLRWYQNGTGKIVQTNLTTGEVTVPDLTVTGGFKTEIEMLGETQILDPYDGVFRGRVITIGAITSGPYLVGEAVDFSPSGAVGVVYNVSGATMVIHLVDGTPEPLNADGLTGRRSGATCTASGVDKLRIASTTSSSITMNQSPNWGSNVWIGYSVEVVAGVGKGELYSIVGNTGVRLDLGASLVSALDSTSILRIVHPSEARRLLKRPYGQVVTRSTGDQAITAATETGVGALTGLTVPGADGVREFAIVGYVQVASVLAQLLTVRIRTGTLGTLSDPSRRMFKMPVGANQDVMIPIYLRRKLDQGERVTVSIEGPSASTVKGTSTAQTSEIRIVETRWR